MKFQALVQEMEIRHEREMKILKEMETKILKVLEKTKKKRILMKILFGIS